MQWEAHTLAVMDTCFWWVAIEKAGSEEDESVVSDRIYVVASREIYAKENAEKLMPGFTAVSAEPCSLQYSDAVAAIANDKKLRSRR